MSRAVRNLPASEVYTYVSAYHTGGLESADCCANCGRAIVEVAILADSQGNSHRVGMDCAETLTATANLSEAQAGFAKARQLVAKLRKARKVNPAGAVQAHEYGPEIGYFKQGGFSVQFGESPNTLGHFWKNYPIGAKPYLWPLVSAKE